MKLMTKLYAIRIYFFGKIIYQTPWNVYVNKTEASKTRSLMRRFIKGFIGNRFIDSIDITVDEVYATRYDGRPVPA